MNDSSQAVDQGLPAGELDPTAAQERLQLEALAAETAPELGADSEAVDQVAAPVINPETTARYKKILVASLKPLSSRWTRCEPLNDDEIDGLSEAWGQYLAYKFPDSGPATPLGQALAVSLMVLYPRAMQILESRKKPAAPAAPGAPAKEKKTGSTMLDDLKDFDAIPKH